VSFSGAATIEGIGFAIPSTTAKAVVEQLLEYGEVKGRPSIGITVGPIPDMAKEQYKLPSGLYISDVSKGSDAEKKGIAPGDVLVAVNGQDVTDTEEVNEMKNALSVGDTMVLSIWRNGVIREYTIILKDTNEIYK
jgi:Trypsin-like serine proteases, typically periplasmic, contain C-terminal PDZ domain